MIYFKTIVKEIFFIEDNHYLLKKKNKLNNRFS